MPRPFREPSVLQHIVGVPRLLPRRVVGASGRCQQLQDTYYSEEMWLAPGEMGFTNPKTMPVTMPQGGQYYVTGFEGTEGAREAGRACQQSWDPNNMLEHTGLT